MTRIVPLFLDAAARAIPPDPDPDTMSKIVPKTRVKSDTDSGVMEECKEAVQCGDCESIEWSKPPKATRLIPPQHTVAIVVNMVSNRGALRIFEIESGGFLGGVGIEEEGHRIIVPWQDGWRFRISGVVEVGYVKAKCTV